MKEYIEVDVEQLNPIFPILIFLVVLICLFYAINKVLDINLLYKILYSIVGTIILILLVPFSQKIVRYIKNKIDIN